MFDLEDGFRDHGEIAFKKEVVDADDGACESVFDRCEESVGGALRNCGEGRIECGARNRGNGFTEKPDGGSFAEGTGFSLEGDAGGAELRDQFDAPVGEAGRGTGVPGTTRNLYASPINSAPVFPAVHRVKSALLRPNAARREYNAAHDSEARPRKTTAAR